MKVFDDYSAYYDLLYEDKNYEQEVEYIHALIQKQFPGAKTILNLGCGTGKHDVLLAEKGYSITAIDLSDTMIDIARKNNTYPDKITFDVGDIRKLELNQEFDVVVSLFHVISYQTSDDDLVKAFSTARKHLVENGIFLFDYWYGPGVMADPPHNRKKVVENDQLIIRRQTTANWVKEANKVEVVFDIEIANKHNQDTHQLEETHPMRYLFEEDIQNVSATTGFERLSSYKWLTEDAPTENDWYVIDILR